MGKEVRQTPCLDRPVSAIGACRTHGRMPTSSEQEVIGIEALAVNTFDVGLQLAPWEPFIGKANLALDMNSFTALSMQGG